MANNLTVVARLTNKPKLIADGKCVVFTIAENYTDKINGKPVRQTLYINCSCFGNSKDYALNYFDKGVTVFVSGTLKQDVYTDKNGVERVGVKMLVDKVARFDGKASTEDNVKISIDTSDDDMPNFDDVF
jgi:single-strand DNA-binding protein